MIPQQRCSCTPEDFERATAVGETEAGVTEIWLKNKNHVQRQAKPLPHSDSRIPNLRKHTIVFVDYATCAPEQCAPDTGGCASVKACSHKVLKQIDGAFEPPALFQNLCLTCSDCQKACPLGAIKKRDTF